jgi:oligoendopeptidase F
MTKDRNAIDNEYTWKLDDLYPSDADWESDLTRLTTDTTVFAGYRGNLGQGETLVQCLTLYFELSKRYARLESYAERLNDQDGRAVTGQELKARIQQAGTELDTATAWVGPEILALPQERLAELLAVSSMKDHRHFIDNITRRRAHIRSPSEEELIARAGDVAVVPEDTYQILSTINMPFPEIALKSGEKVTLTQAMYTRYRSAPDRDERINVFHTFWNALRRFRESFARLLTGAVARDHFYAVVRAYSSDLESALDHTNVPTALYTSMIEQARAGREHLWRYLKLRKRLLGLAQLAYHDLYTPIVSSAKPVYPYESAKEILLQACAPLGPEYVATLAEAFRSRWVDVYPTIGKRSGAYMAGSAYDVHPYLLLNYNDDYESLSTMAHEFGHALHSHLSNKTQPFATARYPIFIAEIASTLNENLLRLYLLGNVLDRNLRLFLLGQYLENFRQTVFRQALFAEFELMIHDMAKQGTALTADLLDQKYLNLLREYYGEAEGVMTIDPLYATEWAYIPHFYYNFYMFQYTTSFIAATALSNGIFSGDEVARGRYLDMLKAGGSKYPVELLQIAGVDLGNPAVYREAFKAFNQTLDEIESLCR